MQAWICIERSSRPPNAPPTPPSESRTASGGSAEARRDLVAVDVQPLRRDVQLDAAGAVRHREARLGAEEGLVLHPDLVAPAHDDVGGRVRVAAQDLHAAQHVAALVQRGASGVSACSASVTGSSTSKSTAIRSAAWRAVSGWSAATIASGSPLKRTSLHASTGWSACSSPYVLRPGTSACVSTACTPGSAAAALVSSERIRARGCGLRSVAPQSMPSMPMSDEYSNSPRTFGIPSARSGLEPMPPAASRGRAGATGAVMRRAARRPAGPRR